jgi:uncharacterized protein
MRSKTCAIGVMAKAPQPGRTKTRLLSLLTPDAAAELSGAFLRDVTENIRLAARDVSIDGCIAYAPAGQEALFAGRLAEGTFLLLADGSPPMPPRVQGFGRCLLHAVQSMLSKDYAACCVLNADSPTLPTDLLRQAAVALLSPGERVVLGPAEDGGYYLLGMTRPHAHLFEDIVWSAEHVAEATRERARALGLDVVELTPWYDVDDAASLRRLIDAMGDVADQASHSPYPAPFTAACLARLGLTGAQQLAAQ